MNILKFSLRLLILISCTSIGFAQNPGQNISNSSSQTVKIQPEGIYHLKIDKNKRESVQNNPSGKIIINKINDSAFAIKLRYTGVSPAKNMGIINDTIIVKNGFATYLSKEDNTCSINFIFTANSVKVEQRSESMAFACGFGRNVHIDGEYIKEKKVSNISSPLKSGKIGITLHWIGWQNRGIANIIDSKNGFFQIQGKQTDRNGNDFIEITGILHQSTPSEIIFEGMIKTRVSYINKGNVCERKGKYTFVAKPGKKYWRLNESNNCEGGMVVDYIDLYL